MDLLRLPLIGDLVRWRRLRLALQLVLLAVAVVVVLHGVLGPQIAPRNLATVLTSIHWRGLLIVALLAAGNVFCTACPMVLVRDAGRRLVRPRWSWPRRLRRKWVAAGLLLAVLFAYEAFYVWESPARTAWLIAGYFAVALTVDLLFKGAAFCKYVCPIGQFNFVASTMSPTELRVREEKTCRDCRTSDCIKGRPAAGPQPFRRGCELGLFMPAKIGNLDCTLCLDCVQACPHDNIGLFTRIPGRELLETGRRSGIGRLARRPDLAVLAIVFTFAALVSAFLMTAPAAMLERTVAAKVPLAAGAAGLAMLFLLALVAVPAAVLSLAAIASRAAAGTAAGPLSTIAMRYGLALVPLGLGVWLAHYGFHLLTGILTVVPVTQSAAIDLLGWAMLGEPAWRWAGMSPGSVQPIQMGLVLLGACGAAGLVEATSRRDYPQRALAVSVPWFIVVAVLAAASWWMLSQPMAMRGLGAIG